MQYSYNNFVNRYLYPSTILNTQLIVVSFAVELLLLLSFLFYCYCWAAILVVTMVRRMVDRMLMLHQFNITISPRYWYQSNIDTPSSGGRNDFQ